MVAEERFKAIHSNWSNDLEEIGMMFKGRRCEWIVKDPIRDCGQWCGTFRS
jgi:hypothetical protein